MQDIQRYQGTLNIITDKQRKAKREIKYKLLLQFQDAGLLSLFKSPLVQSTLMQLQ